MVSRRIELDGRIFFVGQTRTGVLKVTERFLWASGKPWACWSNKTLYHAGKGRKPGPMARRVLTAAEELKDA